MKNIHKHEEHAQTWIDPIWTDWLYQCFAKAKGSQEIRVTHYTKK